jgi:hypothetical protein
MKKLLSIASTVLSLIISVGTVQAGFLGRSLAEYKTEYADSFTAPAIPYITLFRRDGLETDVVFYKDRAVMVEISKLSGGAFSDSEIRGILESNTEGAPWLFEKGAWINGHGFAPSAASLNPDKTSLVIVNFKEELERQLSKIGNQTN